MTSWIEVIGRISGRRHWTVEQKLGMLRDAFGPDGRVRAAMERHEVSSGQLYTWRREAMSGALRSSVPVVRPTFAQVQGKRGLKAAVRRLARSEDQRRLSSSRA